MATQIDFSQEQKQIIYSENNKNQKIIACAGSGKSTTLIYRIKHLIEEKKIDPMKIILSTYNLIVQDLKHITQKVYQYLKDNQNSKNIFKDYQYFFFDEFQDISQEQYEIFMLFFKNKCKVIAIGDPNQSIYSFRNSKIEYIQQKFGEDIIQAGEELETFNLSLNFRCQTNIINFCNQIIRQFDKQQTQMIEPPLEVNKQLIKDKPKVYNFKSAQAQYEDILNDILDTIKSQKEYKLKDIVILSPRNKDLNEIEGYIVQKNTQIKLLKQQNNDDKSQMQDMIPYIRLNNKMNNFNTQSNDDHLTLSTFHSSKGLEWKIVYIIGINDSMFPEAFLKKSYNQKEKNQECLRLFYVACTRAIDQLHFSFIQEPWKEQGYICRYFQIIKQNLQLINIKDDFNPQQIVKMGEQFYHNSKNQNRNHTLSFITKNFNQEDYEKANFWIGLLDQKTIGNLKDAIVTYNQIDLRESNQYEEVYSYIDLFMQRFIAQEFNLVEGYSCKAADQIYYSQIWTIVQKDFIKENQQFFQSKDLNIDSNSQFEKFVENFKQFSNINSIDEETNQLLKTIFEQIKQQLLKDDKIKYKDIINFLDKQKYFPDNFQEDQQKELMESYEKFKNKEVKIDSNYEIKQQIESTKFVYRVNKLNLVHRGINKSLFLNDDINHEILHKFGLMLNIKKFINYLKQEQIKTPSGIKKVVEDEQLKGVVDLVFGDNLISFIYDFPEFIQNGHEISIQQILQALAQAFILQKEGINIKKIVFYNILVDQKIIYDIKNIDEKVRKEILDFIHQKVKSYLQNDNQILSNTQGNRQAQSDFQDDQLGLNILNENQQSNNDDTLILQSTKQLCEKQNKQCENFQNSQINSLNQTNSTILTTNKSNSIDFQSFQRQPRQDLKSKEVLQDINQNQSNEIQQENQMFLNCQQQNINCNQQQNQHIINQVQSQFKNVIQNQDTAQNIYRSENQNYDLLFLMKINQEAEKQISKEFDQQLQDEIKFQQLRTNGLIMNFVVQNALLYQILKDNKSEQLLKKYYQLIIKTDFESDEFNREIIELGKLIQSQEKILLSDQQQSPQIDNIKDNNVHTSIDELKKYGLLQFIKTLYEAEQQILVQFNEQKNNQIKQFQELRMKKIIELTKSSIQDTVIQYLQQYIYYDKQIKYLDILKTINIEKYQNYDQIEFIVEFGNLFQNLEKIQKQDQQQQLQIKNIEKINMKSKLNEREHKEISEDESSKKKLKQN
ncbi:hypothetical protein ABPG73_012085 [Tetrahymena malaccensis]